MKKASYAVNQMIKITVSTSCNYDVIMKRGALAQAGAYIKETLQMNEASKTSFNGTKLCIVTDQTVDKLYGQEHQALWTSLASAGFHVYKYVFPGGEKNKSMATIESLLNYLADNKFTRSDILLALGGGITGDITGFAAASFLRGIAFFQVPTSLLAIVDSSVGGKTGVNLNAGKNLAGAFWQPSLVLFDPDVLSTLSCDLKLDGVAEAVKAGCIADKRILDMIRHYENSGGNGFASGTAIGDAPYNSTPAFPAMLDDNDFLTSLAAQAIEVKRQIVEADERENNLRQLLNFGHTIAHAIEKCSSYQISHGHAVATGMVMISAAAEKFGLTKEHCYAAILDILHQFQFPLDCPYTTEDLTEAALQDKKRRGETITLVIPKSLGHCTLKSVPASDLRKFIACGMAALINPKGITK